MIIEFHYMDLSLFIRSIIFGILLTCSTWYAIRSKCKFSIQLILSIGACYRLLILILFIGVQNYDTLSYRMIGERVLAGQSIYPDLAYYHYPYVPFLLYVEALDVWVSRLGLPPTLVLKTIFSLFDLAAIYFMYKLSNAKAALIYAVHPSLMLLSAAHGQIEAMPLACILAAIYFSQKKRYSLSAGLFGIAILIKTWPAFLVTLFLRKRKYWYMYIAAFLIPLGAVLLYANMYHASIIDVVHPILSYRGIYGFFGLGIITSFFYPAQRGAQLTIVKIVSNLALILLFIYSWRLRNSRLITSHLTYILLVCICVLSGANPLWLIPFVIMEKPAYWKPWLFCIGLMSVLDILLTGLNSVKLPQYQLMTAASTWLGLSLYVLEIGMLWSIYRKQNIRGTK